MIQNNCHLCCMIWVRKTILLLPLRHFFCWHNIPGCFSLYTPDIEKWAQHSALKQPLACHGHLVHIWCREVKTEEPRVFVPPFHPRHYGSWLPPLITSTWDRCPLLYFFFFYFLCFLGPNLWNMEVPRLGVRSNCWPTPQPLQHGIWAATACSNARSFNSLSEARDQTCVLVDTSWVLNPLSHSGNTYFYILIPTSSMFH